jgi:hypothetical protein
MFDERMVLLYSLMPREAIELAVAYFLALASHLKSTEPSDSWQHVASKGILAGLEVRTAIQAMDILLIDVELPRGWYIFTLHN